MSKRHICKKGNKDSVKCPDKMYPCNYDDSCLDHNGNTLTHNLMIERKLYDSIKDIFKKKNITKLTINEIPPDMLDEILETFDLNELLHIRSVNLNFKNSVDEVLKKKYEQIYKKTSPSKIDNVILELKQALWPLYRKGESAFHYGDFGMPNDWGGVTNETMIYWMDDVLTFKEKKEIVDYIVEDILNDKYWDELKKISHELNKLLEVMGEKNWYSNWYSHMEQENDIYNLLFNNVKDLFYVLDNFYLGLKNDWDIYDLNYDNDYFDKETLDMVGIDSRDIYERFINKTINGYKDYRVGDYFYYYNYNYPTRQSYGIAIVGYDIEKKQKVAIFDGEGYPISELPEWLETQFERIGLNYNYPDDKITDFFEVYNS